MARFCSAFPVFVVEERNLPPATLDHNKQHKTLINPGLVLYGVPLYDLA
jgi:hypothetical protein